MFDRQELPPISGLAQRADIRLSKALVLSDQTFGKRNVLDRTARQSLRQLHRRFAGLLPKGVNDGKGDVIEGLAAPGAYVVNSALF